MAFLHPQSCECIKTELDLFAVPPTQTSIETGSWIEYNPIASLAHGLPIEFNLLGSGQSYIDLANTLLHVTAKVTKANGNDIDNTDNVGPVNLTLHSLFSEIDIKLNDTMITTTNNTYAYRAYLETLLSYSNDAKKSQLQSALYYKDTAGQMDEANANTGANAGLVARTAMFRASAVVDMVGKIHADIFFTDRYLPNDCNIRMRLVRHKDAFCLMSNGQNPAHKLVIQSCKLYVRKVKISPTVFMAHAQALEHGNMKYPIRRAVCKTFTVTNGMLNYTQENLFSGQLPSRVIVGMVHNEAFNGSYTKNPFNFHHYDLTQMKLYVDGQQGYIAPIELEFNNSRAIMGYISLFSGTGKLFRDEGIDVGRADFTTGYTLFAFDLSPDLAEDDHFNLIKEGNIRLEAKFRVALPNTINFIIYAEYENILEIDRHRNVIFDYSN